MIQPECIGGCCFIGKRKIPADTFRGREIIQALRCESRHMQSLANVAGGFRPVLMQVQNGQAAGEKQHSCNCEQSRRPAPNLALILELDHYF